ncbi:MAG: iron-sulfur cluster assembly accessory protein [Candidatus Sericytochromatia bacterium]|uniref:Iron-sulfur cluster assembly accessory protein n=1 Tax=Candidatus Tanganyikabacteria bacterium TaxID=2961651 RepID=A0A937X0G3_9BACT|nr:iron-sulfur cluster assembly accessory protein [Candidatus Tanganyikabacteria bacterium]
MITLTEAANSKVREYLKAQNRDDLALRVYVKPGGCSGFSYGMGLDEARETDTVYEVDGIRVVVDPQSSRFVQGAVVDYKDAMLGGGFAISNPNAASSCGCGSSFRPKEEGAEAEGGAVTTAVGGGCGSGGCC